MSQADPVLLKIYAGEQAEHVARMREQIAALPGAETPVFEELFRRAHTLKGAARAVGVEETERIVHRMEGIFAHFRAQSATPDAAAAGVLNRALDCIEDVLSWTLGERAQPDWEGVLRALDELKGASPGASVVGEPPAPAQNVAPGPDLVRVDAETIEALIGISLELVTSVASEGDARQMEDLAGEMGETLRQYGRLRRACSPYYRRAHGDPGFAPVAECLDYAESRFGVLTAALSHLAKARQQAEWRLRRQVEELHERAAQVRMTSAGSVLGTFGPMVRAVAEQEGKQVTYRAEGLETRADRVVLQALKDAVMHLLRNAVSHGIEPPARRVEGGKPPAGAVGLSVQPQGDRLKVSVEDDGAGLDFAALRREAAGRGLREAKEDELVRLALTPGFSTSSSISTLSGRGMGLSVVQEIVLKLRGELNLGAREGGGTRVTLSVPLSIATEHVLLVADGGITAALPAPLVETVLRKRVGEIIVADGRECIVADSEAVPLVRLSELLGVDATDTSERTNAFPVVIVKTAAGKAAVAVETVIDDREVIVRDTGIPAEYRGLSAGAIPLEDGTVAILLAAGDLIQRFLQGGARQRFIRETGAPQRQRILVVDDSITTRSVERSILEAHGFEVELAVDGQEALEKIRSSSFNLVISDVAMPRMDGFELLEKLKGGKETANLPVILVTSLESPEEQERGLSLGADAYIVKRKFDQRELLATVRQIL